MFTPWYGVRSPLNTTIENQLKVTHPGDVTGTHVYKLKVLLAVLGVVDEVVEAAIGGAQ